MYKMKHTRLLWQTRLLLSRRNFVRNQHTSMRGKNILEQVQMLRNDTNIWSVIKELSYVRNDSFYICDLSDIAEKYKIWTTAMPRIIPHYAVKANDYLPVLKVFAKLGSGFDCASKGEMEKVLSIGVEPERIIYANPTKDPTHIQYAAENGIYLMTFDSETELYKIKNICPQAKLVLRIKCSSKSAVLDMGSKHGCHPQNAASLLKTAHALGINIVGVSFHVGTEVLDVSIYKKAIALSRHLFDEAKKLGYNFNILDIGGGYKGGLNYSIKPTSDVVNSALDDYFSDSSVKIISEPGRFFCSTAFTLACKIHSIRSFEEKSDEHSSQIKYMYYINDGVYNNFNYVITEHKQFHPRFLKNYDNDELYLSSIWGQTCDPCDLVLKEAYLPKLKLGDWTIWENMGAYTINLSTPFNGFPATKIFTVVKEELKDLLKDRFQLGYNVFINQHNKLRTSEKSYNSIEVH